MPRVTRTERVCDVCGSSFIPSSRMMLDKRCSAKCRAIGKKAKAKINSQREEVKLRKRERSRLPKRILFKKRWYTENRERILAEDSEKRKKNAKTRLCDICGTGFIVRTSSALRCSDTCRIEGRKRTNKKMWKSKKSKEYRGRPEVKMYAFIRNTLNKRIKANGHRTFKFVSYTGRELRDHLESSFLPGMTWDNHNVHGWHIDHIIPLSSFTLRNEDGSFRLSEIRCAMALSNLQPLWAKDNISKGGVRRHGKKSSRPSTRLELISELIAAGGK